MVRLEESKDYSSLYDMKDGQLAVVLKWDWNTNMVGLIIQRHGNAAVVLGEPSGKCYPSIFNSQYSEDYRVRVLEEGELIRVISNNL